MIDKTPLSRAEVIKAIERKNPRRVPMIRARSWGEGFEELHGSRLDYFNQYPEDAVFLFLVPIQYEEMGLSWSLPDTGAHDSRAVVDEWGKLDEFIAKLPDPEKDPQFDKLAQEAEYARKEDRYILFSFWRYFFERPWQIRGMENLLTDYYNYPEQVHKLHEALYHHYEGYLRRAKRDLKPDGFWTSDDLGHQTNLFMRPATFRTFIKPYYARTGELLRELGLHWWLHSCGNNTAIMPDLAEVGVNVFHPVQKGTMDEKKIVETMKGKLSFLVGFDVQHILQEATPDGVRAEVRYLIDTFDQPDGGMCLGAGNGILPGTPLENIDALMEETLIYGTAHRKPYQTELFRGPMEQTEQQWIDTIKSRFLPEKATGLQLTLQVELLGDENPDWYLVVKNSAIDIQPGKAPLANATLKASRTDLLDIFSGKINPTQALMTGRIKVSGDLMAASRLVNVFQR